MKRILLLLAILLVLPNMVSAETYYVAENPAGTGDGTSYQNRASVATHNTGTGIFADLAGDTVFLTGDFTSQMNARGGYNGNWVIYDGNDGIHAPARFLTQQNPWDKAFYINNKDYIELRNIHFDNNLVSSRIIGIYNGCNNIRIHDCLFDQKDSPSSSQIIFMSQHGENIEIYNNEFYSPDVADVIAFVLNTTVGNDLVNVSIHNNIMEGCRHNLIYFSSAIFSADKVLRYETGNITRIRIFDNEISAPYSAYCRAWGVSANSIGNPVSDVRIYNNYWHDLRVAPQIKAVSDVYIYNNIIANHKSRCIEVGMSCDGPDSTCIRAHHDTGCYWAGVGGIAIRNEYGPPGPVHIFNNIFYNNSRNGLDITTGATSYIDFDVFVYNNIFAENDFAPNIDSNGMIRGDDAPIKITRYVSSTKDDCYGGNFSIYNNIIYNTFNDEAVRVCNEDSIFNVYELNTELINSERLGFDNLDADPLFSNPSDPLGPDGMMWTADDGLRLQQDSPACGAGEGGSDMGAYPCGEPACQEYWTCTDWSSWSECADNIKTRTRVCTDQNECGTTDEKPPETESQLCDVSPGLIAYYTMDNQDISGNQVLDTSGNGIHATIHDAPQPSTGRISGSLHFDGFDDYLDTGYTDQLDDWTVMVWVRGDSDPGTDRDAGPVMKQENFLISWDHRSSRFREAAGLSAGGTWYPASFGILLGGIWYHIAATYDGEILRAFRNGELITENTDPLGNPDSSAHSMKIARHAVNDYFFAGHVDDVMIWNRSLSATEILDLYDNSFHAADDNPKDGCVEEHELIPFIDLWKYDSTTNPMGEVMEAVTLWSRGTGCI